MQHLSSLSGRLAPVVMPVLAGIVVGCGDSSPTCLTAAGTVSCDEATAPSTPAPVPQPEATPEPTTPEPSTPEPAYLLGTRIFDDTTTMSYFHVVPGLDADVSVDVQSGIEVSGSAKLFSAYDLGWFAIGSGESPTVTRYELGADGALVERESMSLLAQGVSDLWDTLYFVSPTKAYYPDRDGGQIIIWNPTTMQVTG